MTEDLSGGLSFGSIERAWYSFDKVVTQTLATDDEKLARALEIALNMIRDREPVRDPLTDAGVFNGIARVVQSALDDRPDAWRDTDSFAEMTGIAADDFARKDELNKRLTTLRAVSFRVAELALCHQVGRVDCVEVHGSGLAYTIAKRLHGTVDATTSVIVFPEIPQHDDPASPMEQIAATAQRVAVLKDIPSGVAVIAVATSTAAEPDVMFAKSMNLAQRLAPDATQIADFPSDPWQWATSDSRGIRTTLLISPHSVFPSLQAPQPALVVVGRQEPDNRGAHDTRTSMDTLDKAMSHTRARLRQLQGPEGGCPVVSSRQLGAGPEEDWIGQVQSWDQITSHLADQRPDSAQRFPQLPKRRSKLMGNLRSMWPFSRGSGTSRRST